MERYIDITHAVYMSICVYTYTHMGVNTSVMFIYQYTVVELHYGNNSLVKSNYNNSCTMLPKPKTLQELFIH